MALQALAEAHVALGVDLGLVDAGDPVLDRVLDGHHVPERRVDPFQAVVEGRGLARADRAGHEHRAVGLGDQAVDHLGLFLVHPQVGEADDGGQDLVDPDHDLLAVDRREGGHAEVARPVVVHDRDPAVLGVPALDDVQVGHHLEPADHGGGHRRLDEEDVLELAVDPVPHPQAGLLGIEVDVGGATVEGAFQDLADHLAARRR